MNSGFFDSYLQRIDFGGSIQTNYETLQALHFHHATHIPFENLDIQLGRGISLDLPFLQRKMIDNRRGGYCFEQNTLFYNVLGHAGFDPIACEARVRMGRADLMSARTHMVLLVKTDGRTYLCDVGFGGEGLLHPVCVDGHAHNQFVWRYRVVQEGRSLTLQSWHPESWFDLYAFLPDPCAPIDFEVANWYTSTHPKSRFVQTLTAQLPGTDRRYILRNRDFLIETPDQQQTRRIASTDELISVLGHYFRLDFDPATRFRNPTFD